MNRLSDSDFIFFYSLQFCLCRVLKEWIKGETKIDRILKFVLSTFVF